MTDSQAETFYSEGYRLFHLGQYNDAFTMLNVAFQHGSIEACHGLAQCYLYGLGTKVNKEYAFGLLQHSALRGHVKSMHELSCCYHSGIGTTIDFNLSYQWALEAATRGHVHSQYNTAMSLIHGTGTAVNVDIANSWLLEAAKKNHRASQYVLGLHSYQGIGFRQDYKKAVYWFECAASQGCPDSAYYLFQCHLFGHGTSPEDDGDNTPWGGHNDLDIWSNAYNWLCIACSRQSTHARKLSKFILEWFQVPAEDNGHDMSPSPPRYIYINQH
jgi:TPR repeat protein